jgi:hypothetical protein
MAYDFVWADKIEAATLLLREFSDSVSIRTEKKYSPDQIIAPILYLLAFQYPWYRFPRRQPLSDWQEVSKSVQQELKKLKLKATEIELESIENQLAGLIAKAIDGWQEGDPEFPKTEIVLNDLVRVLFIHRYINNPPRPNEAISHSQAS